MPVSKQSKQKAKDTSVGTYEKLSAPGTVGSKRQHRLFPGQKEQW